MTFYALVIVLIGQFAWYRSLTALPAPVVSKWSMLLPAFAVAFAFLLLGEIPMTIHWIAAAIIVAGMVVARRGSIGGEIPDSLSEKNLAAA